MTIALLLALQADFVVSPGGRDDAPGTAEKPFATLERAKEAARTLRGKKPVSVLLRGGTFFLDETLVFTAEDSGTAEAPVVYAAWPGEKPVLSGGIPIRGWKEAEVQGRDAWIAESPETRQLFVNGARRPRPRLPREGFYQVAEVLDAGPKPEQGAKRFRFAPGHLKAWTNLQDAEVVLYHFWHEERLPIESVDEADRIVNFQKRSIRRMTEAIKNLPARYIVENVFEALEKPGEWTWDRRHGMIYYLPMPGEDLKRLEAVVPRLRQVVRFDGAEHVVLRGLSIAHSEAHCPARNEELAGPSQAAVTAPGAVLFENSRHCAVEKGEIAHVGSYAVHIAPGSSAVRIVGNEIHDLGAGGVKIGDWESAKDAAGQNVVADNRIHHGGLIYPSAIGVLVLHSGGNTVAHNRIHDFFYTGISVGWIWGYKESAAKGNLIEQNHIHDLGKRLLSDMGGIYTLGPSPGTVLRNNLIHDVDAFDYGGWGIYFDEGSTGIVAENNVTYRTKDGGLHQHYGKENVVRNNVFALAREAQIGRSRLESHLSFTFERNIVYWKEGPYFRKGYSDKPGEQVVFNRNLYFKTGGGSMDFGGMGFEDWQKKGQDGESNVADPLFADPEKGDFTLKPESPALKLGFQPIDLSRVGPRPAVLTK
jgi:hypothetical protein